MAGRWAVTALAVVGAVGCSGGAPARSAACDAGATGCPVGAQGSAGASGCDGGCWHATAEDEQFADSFCGLAAACCARNAFEPDAGVADYAGVCTPKMLRAGFSRDAALRSACLADLQRAAGSSACLPFLADVGSACARTIYQPSGPLAPGQHCTSAADCAGAPGAVTICEHLPTSPSVCMSVVPGRAGDACLGDVRQGWIQIGPNVGGSATVLAYSGNYCSNDAGLFCLPSDDPVRGYVCAQALADGSACKYPRACASGSCVASGGGPASSTSPGTCAPTVPRGTAPAGSACQVDRDCASGRCVERVCSPLSAVDELAEIALCTNL
jgi:hypothetical protein